MKRIITLIALFVSLTSSAQRLTVHSQPSETSQEVMPDSILNIHLFDAGKYLERSGDFQITACGCLIASELSFVMFKDSDLRYYIGGGFLVGAILSEIYAVTYKKKSGMELKIAAGYISLTF